MEQAGSQGRGKPNNWRRKTEGKNVSRKLKGHVLAVGLGPSKGKAHPK
jgi:hypothetical protein